MNDRLTDAELKSYHYLKQVTKHNRFCICQDRDIEYSKNPGGTPISDPYVVEEYDMQRPLTDFMDTDTARKYLYLKQKLNRCVLNGN